MKTLRLAFVMLFATSLAMASETRLNIHEVKEGIYKLSYIPEGQCKINVKILNEAGEVILEERINRSSGFTKKYDLSNQKEGQYTFKIKEKKETLVETVTFKMEHQVDIKEMKDRNKFAVSVTDAQTNMYVNIYDSADRLLYQEKIKQGDGMYKLYDLSQVRSKVLVELTSDRGVIKRATF